MSAATTKIRGFAGSGPGWSADRSARRDRSWIVSDRLARLRESLVDLSLDPARSASTRDHVAKLALLVGEIIDDALVLEAGSIRRATEDRPGPTNYGAGARTRPIAVSASLAPRVSVEATVERRMALMMEEREARLQRDAAERRRRATLAEDFRSLSDDR